MKFFLHFHKSHYKPLNTSYKNNYFFQFINPKDRSYFWIDFFIYYIFIAGYFKDNIYAYIIKNHTIFKIFYYLFLLFVYIVLFSYFLGFHYLNNPFFQLHHILLLVKITIQAKNNLICNFSYKNFENLQKISIFFSIFLNTKK